VLCDDHVYVAHWCKYTTATITCLYVVECNGTLDVAFVLHSAGTVHPERWHYITQFVVDIIEQLDVGLNRTRVAVITWSDAAHVAFTLDRFTTRQDVTQVIISREFDIYYLAYWKLRAHRSRITAMKLKMRQQFGAVKMQWLFSIWISSPWMPAAPKIPYRTSDKGLVKS